MIDIDHWNLLLFACYLLAKQRLVLYEGLMKEASIISTNGALASTVEVELTLEGNMPGSFEVSRHYLVLKPFWIVNPEGTTPVKVEGYYVFTLP